MNNIEKYGQEVGRWYSDKDLTVIKLEWRE